MDQSLMALLEVIRPIWALVLVAMITVAVVVITDGGRR